MFHVHVTNFSHAVGARGTSLKSRAFLRNLENETRDLHQQPRAMNHLF